MSFLEKVDYWIDDTDNDNKALVRFGLVFSAFLLSLLAAVVFVIFALQTFIGVLFLLALCSAGIILLIGYAFSRDEKT